GVERCAAFGTNDDVQFCLFGAEIAERRNVAGERHFHLPPLSLRRNAIEILLTRKAPSLGPPFGRQTSCCPFCTVSFRLPVFAAMSKTAGCSSVTESAASLGPLVVCARTGTAMQVESPTSAARRVTLIVIPVAPKRLARCRSTHVPKML